MKGNLREFQGLLDRKSLITARDQVGATPLHKAVLYGHIDLADYIATNFPVTLDARDNVSLDSLLSYSVILLLNKTRNRNKKTCDKSISILLIGWTNGFTLCVRS
jgi:ankyrin repeat protein